MGYGDNWQYAYPILQKLFLPATIFLVTEKMDTEGFLSWENAKAMSASGLVTFGSHTHTHRHFIRSEPYKNLEEELRMSKSLIETNLGKSCDHLAWPWGDYEPAWTELAKKLGYTSISTTKAGANIFGGNPLELKRINVRNAGTEWLRFRLKWNSYSLPASVFGLLHGWDRWLKVWWNNETPYSHG
jgi:peptidoglycan/xylan/chitin deacetylase (PgdA/CDA1 family)